MSNPFSFVGRGIYSYLSRAWHVRSTWARGACVGACRTRVECARGGPYDLRGYDGGVQVEVVV